MVSVKIWMYFCLNLLFVNLSWEWEPTVDYCGILCFHDKQGPPFTTHDEHTACKCGPTKNDLIDDNTDEFRQAIVDIHNQLRNKIAGGGEAEKGYPPAANMRVLSYDLEAEYIARCWARKMPSVNKDKCRNTVYVTSNFVQNLAWNLDKKARDNMKNISFVRKIITDWYNENDNVLYNRTRWVISYNSADAKENTRITEFATVVWWSHSLVGCARVYIKDSDETTLICNYGGAEIPTDAQDASRDHSVYHIGKPTSACPYHTKPSQVYKNLCGEINPIPTTPIPLIRGEPPSPLPTVPASSTGIVLPFKFLLVFLLIVTFNIM